MNGGKEMNDKVRIYKLEDSKSKLKAALSAVMDFYGTNMPSHLLTKIREALEG